MIAGPASPLPPDLADAVEWTAPGPDAPRGDGVGAMAALLLGIAERRRERQAEQTDGHGKEVPKK